MRLTHQTDYALRMLIYLALHDGRPSKVSDVATSYGISRNHLLKVALKLGRFGYVTTLRGRAGGIALARRPEDINLGEVVRRMEDGFALVDCMRSEGGTCAISPACRAVGCIRRCASSSERGSSRSASSASQMNRSALRAAMMRSSPAMQSAL